MNATVEGKRSKQDADSTSARGESAQPEGLPKDGAPSRLAGRERANGLYRGKGMRVTRRDFLACTVGVAALFALGGTVKAFAGEEVLVRPPGGQDEAAFMASCLKCDRCRSACPQNAIDIAHIEDGLANARTPRMNFKRGACDFCAGRPQMLCVGACANGALRAGFDPSADAMGTAQVNPGECLLTNGVSATCPKKCIDACTFGALSTDSAGHIVVDQSRCNGCGACENACPSASYASYSGSGRRGIEVVARGGRG